MWSPKAVAVLSNHHESADALGVPLAHRASTLHPAGRDDQTRHRLRRLRGVKRKASSILTTPWSPTGPCSATRSSPPCLTPEWACGDVQIAARHADPRTAMRYDRARKNLDRHPNYILAADLASGT